MNAYTTLSCCDSIGRIFLWKDITRQHSRILNLYPILSPLRANYFNGAKLWISYGYLFRLCNNLLWLTDIQYSTLNNDQANNKRDGNFKVIQRTMGTNLEWLWPSSEERPHWAPHCMVFRSVALIFEMESLNLQSATYPHSKIMTSSSLAQTTKVQTYHPQRERLKRNNSSTTYS